MLPPHPSAGTKSPGEIEIFRRLRDDPLTGDWIVLHSLDIAQHRSQIAGEIDFVIIVPTKGVLCLEVKASRSLRRENGVWYYGLNPKPDPRGPFRQASEAMHSIRARVTERRSDLSGVVFWSAVIFPFLEFTIRSTEWHPWQAIDSRQFRRLSTGQIVLNVLETARDWLSGKPAVRWFVPGSNQPSSDQSESIARILRPNFEFFESPEARAERRDEELKVYTQEQFDALDAMVTNPRAIFAGPAGTGKTLLALEAARRSYARGRRILFLCFNHLLGKWLKEQTASLQPYVTTGTLHSHMLSVAGLELPEETTSGFWENELPSHAIDSLLNENSTQHQFDELVIDEAQDILRENHLDFLDLSLKGGLASGKWKLFGDFEKQAIYGAGSAGIQQILDCRFGSAPRYSLRVNCRNTPRIAELVHLLGGLSPGYSRIRRPDNNIEPDIYPYENEQHQGRLLVQSLKELQAEGFSRADIVILSTRSESSCAASQITGVWQSKLRPFRSRSSPGQVAYSTIHAFKGLEAPAIIVTDVELVGMDRSAALFYVAITRALDRLIILVNESARQEMLEILASSK